MSVIPAGTEVSFTITYLEMVERPDWTAPGLPPEARLEKAIDPPAWYFLALYGAVGRDYEWRDRFDQSEAEVAAFVGDPEVELWTLFQDGWPQGFFQLDFREAGVCDLAYFGMAPEAVGKGLGGKMLRIAIAKGWDRPGVTTMTVNTCELDHPRALGLYKSLGFQAVDTETRSRILVRDRDPALFPA